MTVSELHKYFKVELDKSTTTSVPSFLPEEIDYLLNKAYLIVINQKFTGDNTLRQGFEQSQKRISDLSGLIKSASNNLMSCTNSPSTGVCAADFLYFVSGDLIYKESLTSTKSTKSNVISVTHEEAKNFKKTRTNNPIITNPAMVQETGSFVIYYDEDIVFPLSTIINIQYMTFNYDYISFPEPISINDENSYPKIAEHVHSEIVTLAAYLAIENIESPRIQSASQLLTIQE